MRVPLALLAVICALPTTAVAQWEFDLSSNQGYEWNIFRNPESVVQQGDTLQKSRLWQNSTFSEVRVDGDYNAEWDDSQVRLRTDIRATRYHEQTQANEWTYRVNASYRTRYGSGKYFEVSPDIARKQQDGVDPTDPVFSSRLSYRQWRIPVEMDFYLGGLTWLRFEAGFRHRGYDRRDNRQAKYNAYHVEALFKQSIDDRGRFDHEFEISNRTRYRDQTTTEFSNEGARQEEVGRQFTRTETEFLYRLQNRAGLFEVEFPLVATLFRDHPSGSLNYREIEVGTAVDVNLGRAEISVGLDRTLRRFSNFEVGNAEEKLSYGYWTAEAELEYEVASNIFVNGRAWYRSRSSTRDRLTTAFYREYTNAYLQTGLRIELR